MSKGRSKPAVSAPEPRRCPWCSAELGAADVDRCPSCGANLHADPAAEAPGLTRVDLEAILRARAPAAPARGFIGWLSGEVAVPDEPPVEHDVIAPPPADVRAEMLRLELAAREADVIVMPPGAVDGADVTAPGQGEAPSPPDAPVA